MPKGREFLGLPLLETVTGRRLGEVEDLVFNPEKHIISGFLIDKGNWFRLAKQIPRPLIRQVEMDLIKVENPEAVELSHGDCLVSALNGRTVKTIHGKVLGKVQDAVVDEQCKFVTGFEISDGLISDLVTGRAIIQRSSVISESEHALVVEDKLEKIWDSQ